jgi:hypothetical protein
MKNSLKYLGLWQKKRSELKINDDPQADWMQMQDLLDKHLPDAGNGGGGSSHSKKFKLLPILLISLSAAAMTYFAAHIVEIRNQRHHYQQHNHHNWHRSGLHNDSVPNADSSLIKDSTNNKDSIQALKQPAAILTDGAAKPGFDKKATDSLSAITDNKINKGSSSVSKGNNAAILNGAGNNPSAANSSHQHSNNSAQALSANHQTKTNRFFSSHTQRNNSLLNLSNNRGRYQSQRIGQVTDHTGRNNENKPGTKNGGSPNEDASLLTMTALKPVFNLSANYPPVITVPFINDKLIQTPSFSQQGDNKKDGKGGKSGKEKNTRVKSSVPINLDWGLLTGVNSSGSFTAKKQNANFYGSSPVDLYFGLFATYNINDQWGLGTQIKLLNPQTLTGSYTHANESKVDSGQLLNITDTRKAYFVSIPLHVVYKATDILSFKAGPIINIPVKQVSGTSVLQPAGIRSDTSYYNKTIAILGQTQYTPKLNYGLSGGVSIHFQRLIFEATYLKGLSGQKVTSGLGSYNGYYNTFQFTIGFQLNKPKP